ncbi:hypothetical protein V6Z11_A06G038000 [Gossypium hirsutum]
MIQKIQPNHKTTKPPKKQTQKLKPKNEPLNKAKNATDSNRRETSVENGKERMKDSKKGRRISETRYKYYNWKNPGRENRRIKSENLEISGPRDFGVIFFILFAHI